MRLAANANLKWIFFGQNSTRPNLRFFIFFTLCRSCWELCCCEIECELLIVCWKLLDCWYDEVVCWYRFCWLLNWVACFDSPEFKNGMILLEITANFKKVILTQNLKNRPVFSAFTVFGVASGVTVLLLSSTASLCWLWLFNVMLPLVVLTESLEKVLKNLKKISLNNFES